MRCSSPTPSRPPALSGRLGLEDVFSLVRDVGSCTSRDGPGAAALKPAPRVLVVAGIARPERFVAGRARRRVRRGGDDPVPRPSSLRSADLASIAARRSEAGAGVALTTEKDLVRLLPLRPLPMRLAGPAMQRTRRARHVRPVARCARLKEPAAGALRESLRLQGRTRRDRAGARPRLRAPGVRRARVWRGLGLTFYVVDRVHRRVAMTNLATAFPQRTPDGAPRHLPRDVRALRARSCSSCCASARSRRSDAPRVEFEGEDRVVRGLSRRARACSSSRATSATGSCRRSAHGLRLPAGRRRWRARSTTRGCNALLEQVRGVDRQLRDLPSRARARGPARAGRTARASRC